VIGSVLDKYEVLQKLGEGATATVYRGRHLTIGNDVAIKVLHPHLSASSRYRERFNREARAVGRLAHQNIVSILDYSGQSADDCYIVTELVDGVTLLALLQDRGRLPSEIAAMAAADLASALAFAHAQGVIHRDIKPENIMIRRDGRVKLMDFGVARVLDEGSITLDGSLLGSPAYMSPQQALDETLDGRSDLFSLGTVLFHAVTGHVPFAGSNTSVILKNIIEGTRPEVLELAPGASPSLAAVIDRLLQPRPEDRYPSAADAREALLACLAEVGLSPEHPSINLRAYLVDPDGCEFALDAHLRESLLTLGKDRLARGDTLGALQLFNRLLAIDEENPEVIALIQSLHQSPAPATRGRSGVLLGLAASTVLLVAAGGWWLWSRGEVVAPRAHVDPPEIAAPAMSSVEEDVPESLPYPQEDAGSTGSVAPGSDRGPPLPSTPAPVPVATATRAEPGARGLPRIPVETPPPVADAGPAEIVLTLTDEVGEAEVVVDGVVIGKRKGGPTSSWVGTTARPVRLPAGRHVVELRNAWSDPWREEIVVAGGERKTLTPNLRRKEVRFTVNPQLPNECRLTVGGIAYDPLSLFRTFPLRDPDPNTPVEFACPEPLGTFRATLGKTEPGQGYILPPTLPTRTTP
jgi:serine/threonine-protein kinase